MEVDVETFRVSMCRNPFVRSTWKMTVSCLVSLSPTGPISLLSFLPQGTGPIRFLGGPKTPSVLPDTSGEGIGGVPLSVTVLLSLDKCNCK